MDRIANAITLLAVAAMGHGCMGVG